MSTGDHAAKLKRLEDAQKDPNQITACVHELYPDAKFKIETFEGKFEYQGVTSEQMIRVLETIKQRILG